MKNSSALLMVVVAGCAGAHPNGSRDMSRGVGTNSLGDAFLVPDDTDLSTPPTSFPDLGMPTSSPDLSAPASRDLAAAPDLAKPSTGGVVGGETCADAYTLTSGVTVNGDTTGYVDNYEIGSTNSSAACTTNLGDFTYDGPDAVFKISVPKGKTVSALLTKSNLPTVWDPALAIVTDCAAAASSCLGGSDNVSGSTESASWTNSGAAAVTVFIIVDSYLPSEYGVYTLVATVN